MARQEPQEARALSERSRPEGTLAWLREQAPWLFAERLATCVVGSAALAEACRRRGVTGPSVADLDCAWAVSVEDGRALLEEHGVALPVTSGSASRGTLAMRIDGHRIEVTSLRGDGGATLRSRVLADLDRRDTTIGAVAWWLCRDEVLDPHGGVDDWIARRLRAVGDPGDRIEEHPARWLRYYRKAHALGFELDRGVRKLQVDPDRLRSIPPEVVAAELRAALLGCRSPGRFLQELAEAGLLPILAPELAAQFDGRPAGPIRHHPEIGQALHLVLALEWAAANSTHLPDDERAAVLVAVMCHDLGKGRTPAAEFPSHRGHEQSGRKLVRTLLDRLPGLTDPASRRLADQVCALHLAARELRALRSGTLAQIYDEHFRAADFRPDLFALAVAADGAGRLDRADTGAAIAAAVERDVTRIRAAAAEVDAAALREQHTELDAFRDALHQARARAIARALRAEPS